MYAAVNSKFQRWNKSNTANVYLLRNRWSFRIRVPSLWLCRCMSYKSEQHHKRALKHSLCLLRKENKVINPLTLAIIAYKCCYTKYGTILMYYMWKDRSRYRVIPRGDWRGDKVTPGPRHSSRPHISLESTYPYRIGIEPMVKFECLDSDNILMSRGKTNYRSRWVHCPNNFWELYVTSKIFVAQGVSRKRSFLINVL